MRKRDSNENCCYTAIGCNHSGDHYGNRKCCRQLKCQHHRTAPAQSSRQVMKDYVINGKCHRSNRFDEERIKSPSPPPRGKSSAETVKVLQSMTPDIRRKYVSKKHTPAVIKYKMKRKQSSPDFSVRSDGDGISINNSNEDTSCYQGTLQRSKYSLVDFSNPSTLTRRFKSLNNVASDHSDIHYLREELIVQLIKEKEKLLELRKQKELQREATRSREKSDPKEISAPYKVIPHTPESNIDSPKSPVNSNLTHLFDPEYYQQSDSLNQAHSNCSAQNSIPPTQSTICNRRGLVTEIPARKTILPQKLPSYAGWYHGEHRNSVPATPVTTHSPTKKRYQLPVSAMVRSSDDIRNIRQDPATKVSNLFASYDQLCQAVDGLDSVKTSQMFRPSRVPVPASQFSKQPIAAKHFSYNNPRTVQHSQCKSSEGNHYSQKPTRARDFNERAVDCPHGYRPPNTPLSSPKVMRKNQSINSPKLLRKNLGFRSPAMTRKKKSTKERCNTQ